MTPLLLLAEKVEGLEGPDREVDCEITFAVFKRNVGHRKWTASLDAAMSLVPEEWYWSLKRYPRVGCVADIGGIYTGKAHTPPLSLCAAALRARAAMEAGE